jgi:acyl-CoA thioester hydrolase
MYKKTFEIRWSDLDANRHVANSSYADILTEIRMTYLRENGFSQEAFQRHRIGPVIFTEEFYYIKEIKANEKITVTLELLANDERYRYVKFAHCIFNEEERLSVYSETFFGWFSLEERSLIEPPEKLQQIMKGLSKAEKYEVLTNVSLKNSKIPFGKTLV